MSEALRQKFEEHAADFGLDITRANLVLSDYSDEKCEFAWIGYKAASVHQEPVARVDRSGDRLFGEILPNVDLKIGQDLFAAPPNNTALKALIADIKAWDVEQLMTIPHALRVRMQAVIDSQ